MTKEYLKNERRSLLAHIKQQDKYIERLWCSDQNSFMVQTWMRKRIKKLEKKR